MKFDKNVPNETGNVCFVNKPLWNLIKMFQMKQGVYIKFCYSAIIKEVIFLAHPLGKGRMLPKASQIASCIVRSL